MKIYTSYFGNLKKLTKAGIVALGVSRYPPQWFTGATVVELAPQPWMLKKDVPMSEYDKAYKKQLSGLTQAQIIKQVRALAKDRDVALCCFEKEQKDCHRYDIAQWLKAAGYEVEEYHEEAKEEKPKAPPIIQGLLF